MRRVRQPVVAPLHQVRLGERDEGEAAVDEVRLRQVVDVRGDEPRQRRDGDVDDELLAVAEKGAPARVSSKLEVDQVLEGEALLKG